MTTGCDLMDHVKTQIVPASLAAVVALLANNPQLVVAEHNGVIAPRSRWDSIVVKDDDTLEIVTIVGGGS